VDVPRVDRERLRQFLDDGDGAEHQRDRDGDRECEQQRDGKEFREDDERDEQRDDRRDAAERRIRPASASSAFRWTGR